MFLLLNSAGLFSLCDAILKEIPGVCKVNEQWATVLSQLCPQQFASLWDDHLSTVSVYQFPYQQKRDKSLCLIVLPKVQKD
jgi:hypothetical protein